MKELPCSKKGKYTVENCAGMMSSSPTKAFTMSTPDLTEQRIRSESEPIMNGALLSSSFRNSTNSIASSQTTSDRDSVISTSSMSSETNFSAHDRVQGFSITRTSSTRSAPSSTLLRGAVTSPQDFDGFEDEEDEGAPNEEDEERAGEGDDEFPQSPTKLDFSQSTIGRKAAIRRVHTVTPQASPKIRHRRTRIDSKGIEESIWKYELEADCEDSFNITIDVGGCKEILPCPAKRGLLLREIVKDILDIRNIDLANVSVYIESSQSPTPLECECDLFAGKNLFVRAKAKLLNERYRSISTSVVPALKINDGVKTGSRKDLSKFFGVEQDKQKRARRPSLPNIGAPPNAKPMDPKLRALQDKLDDYIVNGLPDFPSLMFFAYPQRVDDADVLKLEDNWRDLVDDHANLSRGAIDQQEAIWEIIHTEVTYIKNIRVIIDIYMTCLIDLQAAGILNSIVTEKIFSNITDIENRHSRFWKEKLIDVVEAARKTREPLSGVAVAQAFEGFGDHFEPYIKFCTDEESCMEFLREKEKEDEQLRVFLQWCLDHRDSRRLKLGDLLVYPMQRLTKCPLLLRAVAKKEECEENKEAIFAQMAEVERFCGRVNHEVRREQESKKMIKMIQRIEAYDWPEVPSGLGSEELGKLVEGRPLIDLRFPMPCACPTQPRWVVHEGSVKIRDQYKNGYDAVIVIFTDMITICKKKKNEETNTLRIVRPPIHIGQVKATELKDNSGFVMLCTDQYNCASNWYVITNSVLHYPSYWLDKINKAKEMYENACSNKDMDRFLDMSYTNNTGGINLEVPDFLKLSDSPQMSPHSSPRSARQFNTSPNGTLKKVHSASGLSRLKEEEEDHLSKSNNVTKKARDFSSEGDSLETACLENDTDGGSSTEDSHDTDADIEDSDSGDGQAPSIKRPTHFLMKRPTSLERDIASFTLPMSDSLTPDNATAANLNFTDTMTSPHSPSAAALNIIAFDDDFENEENPAHPTQFPNLHNTIESPKKTANTGRGFKGLGNLLIRNNSDVKGKKTPPNGVPKTHHLQDTVPSSSGDEYQDDKNKKKKGRTFFKQKTPKGKS